VDEADLQARRSVLRSLGPDEDTLEEVSRYCESRFGTVVAPAPVLPLADEPHLLDWRRYAAEAGGRPFEYLRERIPQLWIPVAEGVSKLPAYQDVTLRGLPLDPAAFGGTLKLADPGSVRLMIHEHPAGALPVIVVPRREDFETLVRCLAWRGEPRPISPAVNAQIVTGFVNWDRMRRYRAEWARMVDPGIAEALWPVEMSRVAASERYRYQDRFIIVAVAPYSSATAAELGLSFSEDEWIERSTVLRVEHEFTHYATQRLFGAMSLNLLDETIADFMGVTYVLGTFKAAWFLRFLGLEAWPEVRTTGRAMTYTEGLSPAGFTLLARLMLRVAKSLEELSSTFYSPGERGLFLLALSSLTLELMAADDVLERFAAAYEEARRLIGAS
jgi:hypothetical protein